MAANVIISVIGTQGLIIISMTYVYYMSVKLRHLLYYEYSAFLKQVSCNIFNC